MSFQEFSQDKREQLIRALQGCIRIPSVYADDHSGYPYGQNIQNCLAYMLDLAAQMGFATHNMDGQLGWCEYGQGEELVAVLGHLDVVPEGEGWTIPPYEGRVVQGKIYGRGAMDDKGPTVAALYALLALKESGLPLKRRVRLIFGLNEETGSADMQYYLAHGGQIPVMGITPDGEYPVINGEKGLVTETFARPLQQSGAIRLQALSGGTAHNIVPAQAQATLVCSPEIGAQIAALAVEKISCAPTQDGVSLTATGVSAHGGTPHEGENAIGRLMQFLAKLPLEGELGQCVAFLAEKIGMEWNGSSLGIAMEDDLSGPLTLNLGTIRWDGQQLEVAVNYRYPVTHSFEECGPVIQAAFAQAGFHQTYIQHKQAIFMPPESPLVAKLLKVYAAYTGQSTQPKCIGGGTYAKMMPNILAFGPIFPGDEVREHKPDEFMEISRLLDNVQLLAAAMYELAT
jgi:succinyl-diaminopimelate desuccinylase